MQALTRRLILLALVAASWLAGAPHAASVTCDVIDAADSVTVKCPKPAVVPVPVVPVVPADPTPPAPTSTAPVAPACQQGTPTYNSFLCAYLNSNPVGNGSTSTTPSAPTGNGTTFYDATYEFRNGAIRRFIGSGTKTAIATDNAHISFSVDGSGENAAFAWQVIVTVNGAAAYEGVSSVYLVTPAILVHTGDVIAITIRGDGVVASARLAVLQ